MKSGKAYYIGIIAVILAAGLLFTGTILAAHSQQKNTISTYSCPDLEITDI
jgi:formate/nitrite transporter FocA (FNT family)